MNTIQEATERRYFWWLIGSVWVAAILTGIVVLMIVARQKQDDVFELKEEIRSLQRTLEMNRCRCDARPVQANGNAVTITPAKDYHDLAREILQSQGHISRDNLRRPPGGENSQGNGNDGAGSRGTGNSSGSTGGTSDVRPTHGPVDADHE